MAFLPHSEIEKIGFKNVGKNVHISDKASIYNPSNISIGSNVRIDDFCVLSAGDGGIDIEDHVHIAVFSLLTGSGKIRLKSFSGLSSRVSIYSSSDDYSGETLTNPTISKEFKNVQSSNVIIGKHVIIGSGSVVLPGVTLNDGAAVGALSLINKDCENFAIYSGMPAKKIKTRKREVIALEKMLKESRSTENN